MVVSFRETLNFRRNLGKKLLVVFLDFPLIRNSDRRTVSGIGTGKTRRTLGRRNFLHPTGAWRSRAPYVAAREAHARLRVIGACGPRSGQCLRPDIPSLPREFQTIPSSNGPSNLNFHVIYRYIQFMHVMYFRTKFAFKVY